MAHPKLRAVADHLVKSLKIMLPRTEGAFAELLARLLEVDGADADADADRMARELDTVPGLLQAFAFYVVETELGRLLRQFMVAPEMSWAKKGPLTPAWPSRRRKDLEALRALNVAIRTDLQTLQGRRRMKILAEAIFRGDPVPPPDAPPRRGRPREEEKDGFAAIMVRERLLPEDLAPDGRHHRRKTETAAKRAAPFTGNRWTVGSLATEMHEVLRAHPIPSGAADTLVARRLAALIDDPLRPEPKAKTQAVKPVKGRLLPPRQGSLIDEPLRHEPEASPGKEAASPRSEEPTVPVKGTRAVFDELKAWRSAARQRKKPRRANKVGPKSC